MQTKFRRRIAKAFKRKRATNSLMARQFQLSSNKMVNGNEDHNKEAPDDLRDMDMDLVLVDKEQLHIDYEAGDGRESDDNVCKESKVELESNDSIVVRQELFESIKNARIDEYGKEQDENSNADYDFFQSSTDNAMEHDDVPELLESDDKDDEADDQDNNSSEQEDEDKDDDSDYVDEKCTYDDIDDNSSEQEDEGEDEDEDEDEDDDSDYVDEDESRYADLDGVNKGDSHEEDIRVAPAAGNVCNKSVKKLPSISIEGDDFYVTRLTDNYGFRRHLEVWVGEMQTNSNKNATQIVKRGASIIAYVDNELGKERKTVVAILKYVLKHQGIIGSYCHYLLQGGYKPRE